LGWEGGQYIDTAILVGTPSIASMNPRLTMVPSEALNSAVWRGFIAVIKGVSIWVAYQ
jgi:hypothetical protein